MAAWVRGGSCRGQDRPGKAGTVPGPRSSAGGRTGRRCAPPPPRSGCPRRSARVCAPAGSCEQKTDTDPGVDRDCAVAQRSHGIIKCCGVRACRLRIDDEVCTEGPRELVVGEVDRRAKVLLGTTRNPRHREVATEGLVREAAISGVGRYIRRQSARGRSAPKVEMVPAWTRGRLHDAHESPGSRGPAPGQLPAPRPPSRRNGPQCFQSAGRMMTWVATSLPGIVEL